MCYFVVILIIYCFFYCLTGLYIYIYIPVRTALKKYYDLGVTGHVGFNFLKSSSVGRTCVKDDTRGRPVRLTGRRYL
jgi:hypothetical protein